MAQQSKPHAQTLQAVCVQQMQGIPPNPANAVCHNSCKVRPNLVLGMGSTDAGHTPKPCGQYGTTDARHMPKPCRWRWCRPSKTVSQHPAYGVAWLMHDKCPRPVGVMGSTDARHTQRHSKHARAKARHRHGMGAVKWPQGTGSTVLALVHGPTAHTVCIDDARTCNSHALCSADQTR
jgi:hypothetical protein